MINRRPRGLPLSSAFCIKPNISDIRRVRRCPAAVIVRSEVIQEPLPVKQEIPLCATSRFTKTIPSTKNQRQRDDNKNKICAFEGGGPWGRRGESSKNAVFFFSRGKRHDNKILKVQFVFVEKFCCHCARS